MCTYTPPSTGVRVCPALAVDGFSRCAVHLMFSVRARGDVGIKCYACGHRIRIGGRYLVKAEGAFHQRSRCSQCSPGWYVIPIDTSSSSAVAG
jgi:hypothetical protein